MPDNPLYWPSPTVPKDLQNWQGPAVSVASIASIDLDSVDSVFVDVTGTTTITSVFLRPGKFRVVRFTGVLTLTHSANLSLPGAVNRTTQAGDVMFIYSVGDAVIVANYFNGTGAEVRAFFAGIPTADGTGTGTIPAGASFVNVTSADANNIMVLPDAPIGTRITLQNGGTGYELRSSNPAVIGINGGTGVGAESAIGASITVYAERVTTINWKCFQTAANGTPGATEVAA